MEPEVSRVSSIVRPQKSQQFQVTLVTSAEQSIDDKTKVVGRAYQRKFFDDIGNLTSFSGNELDALFSHYSTLSGGKDAIDKEVFTKCMGLTFGDASHDFMSNLFNAMDRDGNGTISFKEFALALSTVYRGQRDDVLEFWFKMYDKDRSGLLDASELDDLLQGISIREKTKVSVLLNAVEGDNSRKVSLTLDEFKAVVEQCNIFPQFVNPHNEIHEPAFSDMNSSEREVLFMLGTEQTLEKGSPLIKEGVSLHHFYFVVTGDVELTRDGHLIGTQSAGTFVGEAALFEDLKEMDSKGEVTFTTSVRASTPATVLRLSINDFYPLVNHGHPGATSIMERLGSLMLDRFEEAEALFSKLVEGQGGATRLSPADWATLRKQLNHQWALRYHNIGRKGKLEIVPTKVMGGKADLSVAYSPGVAEPCLAIQQRPDASYEFTARGHLVGVITNGTAVLGLGDIGALAGKPVMEGKAVLFKKFADVDAFDIEVNEKDPSKLIDIVVALEPTFGGVNLEDIKAPECFRVERECQARMNIPVFHDDQHGTAIIASAGLLNALELVGKRIEDIRVVVCGVGAAGYTCAMLFKTLGVQQKNLFAYDKEGVVYPSRADLVAPDLQHLLNVANDTPLRSLEEVLEGADVFLGLSAGGLLKPELLKKMNKDPVIFACANPTPEIDPQLARATRPDVIIATGRSDYPNQINNVCAFPYIFRGALDCRAKKVNEEMKLAAVHAIAKLAKLPAQTPEGEKVIFGRDYIIPKPFDERLLVEVSAGVVQAALETGVARLTDISVDTYRRELQDVVRMLNKH